jgi:hypothetical protein
VRTAEISLVQIAHEKNSGTWIADLGIAAWVQKEGLKAVGGLAHIAQQEDEGFPDPLRAILVDVVFRESR